jgi:hypothetical protein
MEALALNGGERKPAVETETRPCEQCGNSFTPRQHSGGRPQRFCSSKCRQASHTPAEASQASLPAIVHPPALKPAENDSDFNWSDDDSIILREQPATACYFNKEGSLVIRQRRWPDDDTFIFIAAGSIADFLDKLTDICGIPSVGGPSK